MLTHSPPRHRPGSRAHSSVSMHTWNIIMIIITFIILITCILGATSYPSSQSHSKPPCVLRQVPGPHTPRVIRHSSMSAHRNPLSSSANPRLQSHSKEPTVLRQLPCSQMSGNSRHSFMSSD